MNTELKQANALRQRKTFFNQLWDAFANSLTSLLRLILQLLLKHSPGRLTAKHPCPKQEAKTDFQKSRCTSCASEPSGHTPRACGSSGPGGGGAASQSRGRGAARTRPLCGGPAGRRTAGGTAPAVREAWGLGRLMSRCPHMRSTSLEGAAMIENGCATSGRRAV